MLYEDMLKGVLSKVRSCPEVEAIAQMRNAVREWCIETRCLTYPARVITSSVVDPIQFPDMYVVGIVDAEIAGEPIDVLGMNDAGLKDATATHPVLAFADEGYLQMVPEPVAPVTVDLLLSVAPGADSLEAPDVLWQRFSEHLTHGALARLLSQDGELWAKPAKAGWHERKWQDAITQQAALSGRNRSQRAQRLRVIPV